MNSKSTNRRGFLKGGAALAGLAVGAMPFTRAQTLSSDTAKSARPRTFPTASVLVLRTPCARLLSEESATSFQACRRARWVKD